MINLKIPTLDIVTKSRQALTDYTDALSIWLLTLNPTERWYKRQLKMIGIAKHGNVKTD